MQQPRALRRETPMTQETLMANLIATLLASAVKTHYTHLRTTSYAAHMALGEFYGALPDMADNIAEQYQGVMETLLEYPTVDVAPINSPQEAVVHMNRLYNMVQQVQDNCGHSEIINELDLIKSCINKTKYKLIFLK